MSIQQFLLALRARLGLLILILAATVLAAAAVSLLIPKSYKATVSLLVDTNKDEQSLSNSLRPLMIPQERANYLQTQVDIITGDKVAHKVVKDLKLAQMPSKQTAFQKEAKGLGTIEDWLAEGLLKKLKVETSQSNVIQVTFSSPDPAFSAQVANAFAKSYIDTMLELRVEPTRQAAVWFDEQLKSLRASLEDTQTRLTDYQKKQGIISADERYDVENARLGELSSQLVKAQEQAVDLETREQQARDFLRRGASPDRLPDVLSNVHIQKLKEDLARGEARLNELSSQYGVNHPQYQRQVSENRGQRAKLDSEMKLVVAGLENSRRQSRQRVAEVTRSLAAQRALLLELKGNRNELTVLTRNAETAQRAYETAMQRFVVNQVDSRASQTNATLLSPAAVPARASYPIMTLNIALSLVVGLMLGMGAVIMIEMTDRRVRSIRDMEFDVPLLAVLNAWRPPRGTLQLAGPGGPARALPSAG
jgi:protein tyrosine kinase modulator